MQTRSRRCCCCCCSTEREALAMAGVQVRRAAMVGSSIVKKQKPPRRSQWEPNNRTEAGVKGVNEMLEMDRVSEKKYKGSRSI